MKPKSLIVALILASWLLLAIACGRESASPAEAERSEQALTELREEREPQPMSLSDDVGRSDFGYEMAVFVAESAGVEGDLRELVGETTYVDIEGDFTLLHEAVSQCNADAVQWLVMNGADVNAQDIYGATPLFYAAEHLGNCPAVHQIAELLLNYGADPEIANQYGATPLLHASRGCHTIFQLLIEAGADPCVKSIHGKTALHQSVLHPSRLALIPLDQCGPLARPPSQRGLSSLRLAIIASSFFDESCEEVFRGDREYSSLQLAAVSIILRSGGDPDWVDFMGLSVLQEAKDLGLDDRVINLLEEHSDGDWPERSP